MVELIANDTVLEIVNVAFTLTMQSGFEGNNGSYVYSFTIPYTAVNAKAFNFPYRLARYASVQTTVEGSIVGDGITLKEGDWYARSSNGKTISIEMRIGAGIFNVYVHERTLPVFFDIETKHTDIVEHIDQCIEKSYPEVNHNWPCIWNPSFYGDDEEKANPSFDGVINDWDYGSVHIETTNNNAISPQLYLAFIIKQLFAHVNYSVSGRVFKDPRFLSAMLYNNFALDKLVPNKFYGEMEYKIPFYNQDYLIWDKNIDDPGNHYNPTTGRYMVDKEGNYQIDIVLYHVQTYLPTDAEESLFELFYGNTLIDSVQQPHAFGTKPHFILQRHHLETIDQADTGQEFYAKFVYLDINGNRIECRVITGNITIRNISEVENNTFQNVINYKNHVPDMDVKEFLQKFYSTAKIIPIFDDKHRDVKMVFIDDILASNKQVPYSDGIKKDSLIIKHQEDEGLKFAFDFQGPDNNLDDNFLDISQADIIGERNTFELLPASAEVGHIYFIKSINCYYIWAIVKEETDGEPEIQDWVPYCDNHFPLTYGDGKKEFSIGIAPMLMRAAYLPRPGTYPKYREMASIDAMGTSIAYGLKNEFPLRIMFWVGKVDGAKDIYPIAITSMYDQEFTQVQDYNWTVDQVVKSYMLNYVAWLQNRIPVEFKKELNYAEIFGFDLQNAANIEDSLILLQKISCDISSKKEPQGRFKGWTK